MKKTFLVSDTHFGHKGVCHFLNADGSKLRPWDNPDDMDRDMISYWNSVVSPTDKVYHLGDVVINRRALAVLEKAEKRFAALAKVEKRHAEAYQQVMETL